LVGCEHMNLAKVGETPLAGLETSLRRWITGLAHELQGITDAAHRVVVPDEYIETLVGLRAPFDLHRRLGRVGRVKRSDRNHLIEFHAEGAFVGERERNEATTFHSYARDPAAPHQGFATAVPRVSMSWMNFEAPATVRGAAGTAC
jgi:hypothetical protein